MPNFLVPHTPISMMASELWTFSASRLNPLVAFGLSPAILSISFMMAFFCLLSCINWVCMSSTPPDFGAVLAESIISFAA